VRLLAIHRSPLSGILQARGSLPEELARVLAGVRERPEKFAWVVPTGRRKRAMVNDWLRLTGSHAPSPAADLPTRARGESPTLCTPDGRNPVAVLPRFFTLESFVTEAMQYSPRQKPRISGPERLLRLAGIWQDLTGRSAGPGVISQFDRYIRDCQACGVRPSSTSKDKIDQLVNRYLSELNGPNGWLDRMSAVVALPEEISSADSWPNRIFFERFEAILIDGFHRLEPVELDLIAALGKVREVVLWLVGNPGTPAWETVKSATEYLQGKEPNTFISDRGFEDSAPATQGSAIQMTMHTPFSEFGRRLFQRQNDQVGPLLASFFRHLT
jgi:hypothetical protein